jgi:prolipoprotein diacylglyceryl transferase
MLHLVYVTWDIDPEIFRFGFFSLHWYGLLFGVAFVLGYYIVRKMFQDENIPMKKLDHLIWYMVFGTFFGARLGHCLFYEPGYFLSRPLEIILPFFRDPQGAYHFIGYQGLASHGAALGILTALYLFSRIEHRSYLWILDRIVIVVALSGFFIRVGNLMNSEIYGIETAAPWGFLFVLIHETTPKHPTQIYEALSYLSIFGLLYGLYLKKNIAQFPGVIFGIFLVLLFSLRFLIEFIKEDQVAFEKGMTLNMGQFLSIPLILLGIVLLISAKRKVRKNNNFAT